MDKEQLKMQKERDEMQRQRNEIEESTRLMEKHIEVLLENIALRRKHQELLKILNLENIVNLRIDQLFKLDDEEKEEEQ